MEKVRKLGGFIGKILNFIAQKELVLANEDVRRNYPEICC